MNEEEFYCPYCNDFSEHYYVGEKVECGECNRIHEGIDHPTIANINDEKLIEKLKSEVYVEFSNKFMCRPLHGTTNVWVRKRGKALEMRMGFTYPGAEARQAGMNPFDPEYHEPWIRGIGLTTHAAFCSLRDEATAMAEAYWV